MAAGYYFYNFIRRPKVKRNEMERQRNVNAFVRHFSHLILEFEWMVRNFRYNMCLCGYMNIPLKFIVKIERRFLHLFDLVLCVFECASSKLAEEILSGMLASCADVCICGERVCVCSYFMLKYTSYKINDVH